MRLDTDGVSNLQLRWLGKFAGVLWEPTRFGSHLSSVGCDFGVASIDCWY